jgi:hypothetical protein
MVGVTWSESVYLDAVSADGTTGFVTRLARHTDGGVAWLWLHAFLPGGEVVGFVRDDLPCDAGRTVDDGPGVVYALDADGVSCRFERCGPAGAPTGANVRVRFGGVSPATLDATFSPDGAAGSNLPGRTEVLGRVEATVSTASGSTDLRARGQFHEQHQDAPRFTVPFTYGTLRGERVGTVFLIGPARSGGFVHREGSLERATSVSIDPVGASRSLRLAMERGGELVVDLRRTHHYLLPINGRDRESSLVYAVTGDDELSGCVNDWQPA